MPSPVSFPDLSCKTDASGIPVAATEAMRHLPKLIYGTQKINALDKDALNEDADLNLSELTSSLRMITKRYAGGSLWDSWPLLIDLHLHKHYDSRGLFLFPSFTLAES